ncbi:Crp/Fnr family transcriptional regulator [Actinomadura oligospora]|uniref:Crp/Fnr family transcriptional regulator n=1 Tax=Actinomadura oligospora TaxID=111804 RepID=UPI00047C9723|nr:Crp/Fnr family transcriptional regulator [Actinomadura oligospora]
MAADARHPYPLRGWPERSLLGTLPPATRDRLLELGTRRQIGSGETIITEGDTVALDVYLIEDGSVKIVGHTEEGESVLLSIRETGDLVGELAVLDGSPRLASVTTIRPCVVRRIGQAPFLKFLACNPDAWLAVSRVVTAKLRNATWHRVEHGSSPTQVRIARTLLLLALRHGEFGALDQADGPPVVGTVVHGFTHTDIASLAGLSRDTVQRGIRELRRDGVVHWRYKDMVVRDWAALHSVAGITEIPPEYGIS